MMDFIMVPVIIGIITYGIYSLFELFARRKERLALIEKIGSGSLQGDIKMGSIEFSRNSNKFTGLKWACMLMGLGFGLLVGFIIGEIVVGYGNNLSWGEQELLGVVYGASVLLFGGFGLLIAFLVENSISKKKEK